MKILIELPEDMYDDIEDGYICQEYADDIISIVKNGTTIPDTAAFTVQEFTDKCRECGALQGKKWKAIREEITEMIEKEEVYHTKEARAQIIALEWALEVIESHTKGESE